MVKSESCKPQILLYICMDKRKTPWKVYMYFYCRF